MTIKQDRITLLRELLVTQMNHWMLFPFYAMILTIISDVTGTNAPHMLLWLAFGSIPFLLYLGRSTLQKMWALLLLHAAVILLMVLLPAAHLSIKIIHIFIGIVYVIYSCYLWVAVKDKKDSKLYPLLGVGFSVLMLIILNNQGHSEWDTVFVTILIIALGFYFIIYYIERYQNFLTVNNSSAGHIPAKEMFHSGMGLVIGYTSVGLLILLLISNIDWLHGILQGLKKMLARFINFFFALFPQGTGDVAEKVEEAPVKDEMAGELFLTDIGETFWIWKVVDVVVEIAFTALIIFIVIKAVIFLVKLIRNKLSGMHFEKQKDSNKEEVLDVREKCDIVRNNDWKMNLPFVRLNPKERIRQLYKKQLLTSRSSFSLGSDTKLLNRYTARESSKILEKDELALIYEKARYSNEECNNEDVKRMRNACK